MSHDSWTYILVNNGPGLVPDQVQLRLKLEACTLYQHEKETATIQSRECTGTLKSTRQAFTVRARTGILFKAELQHEGESGVWQINFLLSIADLGRGKALLREIEEGEGVARHPITEMTEECPELYRFRDLSRA